MKEILERDVYADTALGLLRAGGAAALEGRALVTEYNRTAYLFRWGRAWSSYATSEAGSKAG